MIIIIIIIRITIMIKTGQTIFAFIHISLIRISSHAVIHFHSFIHYYALDLCMSFSFPPLLLTFGQSIHS